jgi:hypothetical protein
VERESSAVYNTDNDVNTIFTGGAIRRAKPINHCYNIAILEQLLEDFTAEYVDELS